MAGSLRLTLVKSTISHTRQTRGTVRALGLHRLGQTVEVADTREMRGMARAVRFLLSIEEVGARPAEETAAPAEDSATPRGSRKKEESTA